MKVSQSSIDIMLERARMALVGTGRMGEIRAKVMYANPFIDLVSVVDVD